MAQLNATQLAVLRRRAKFEANRNGIVVHWNKPEINAAFQALEDATETNSATGTIRTILGVAIETAVPGVFNVAEKEHLVAVYWIAKAQILGADIFRV